jgi:hypothetical protein
VRRFQWLLILAVSPALLLGRPGSAGTRPERAAQRSGVQSDPTGLQLVGSWPYGPSQAVAGDAQRQVVFSSAGGVVRCIDLSDPAQPRPVGTDIYTAGAVQRLVYDSGARRLYVACGNGRLEIWDVGDLGTPVRRGSAILPAGATGLDLQSGLLYCAIPGPALLVVVSVADPAHPFEIGRLEFEDYDPLSVLVAGNRGYVGCDGALAILNLTQPSQPQLMALYDDEVDVTTDIELNGWLVCLASEYGVTIVDVSDPYQPEFVAYTEEWDFGAAQALELRGWYAYVVDDDGILAVVDVSNPAVPRVVAQMGTGGEFAYYDVVLLGNSACAAAGEQGLLVADIARPAGPDVVCQLGNEDQSFDAVAAENEYLYAFRDESLFVYDVSDPTGPLLMGRCSNDTFPWWSPEDIAVQGGYLYVSEGDLGIVDVSDPTNPHIVGRFSDLEADQIDVAGDYVYCVTEDNWLQVIDVSDRTNPHLYRGVVLGGSTVDVAVTGQLCCVLAEDTGLFVLDASDPSNPLVTGFVPTFDAARIATAGRYVYIAGHDTTMYVYDLANPGQPVEVGALYSEDVSETPLVADGRYVYALSEDDGLHVFDVFDPTRPLEVAHLPDENGTYWTAVASLVAWVVTDARGIVGYDVEDPSALHWVGGLPGCDGAAGIAAGPGGIYLAAGLSGLVVLDTGGLPELREDGRLDSIGLARCVAVSGNTAWLAAGTSLLSADISDPANPRKLGAVHLPSSGRGLALAGNLAYVGNYGKGLTIVDIADPAQPRIAGNTNLPNHVYGVAVSGNYAYFVNRFTSSSHERHALYVADVSDPSAPRLVDSCGNWRYAYDVAVKDTLAYVATRYGCRVVNVADPTQPVPVDSFGTGDWRRVLVDGQCLYAACAGAGVQVFNLSRPGEPELMASYDTPGTAVDIFVDGPRVYVADDGGGAELFTWAPTGPAGGPSAPTRVRVARNPAGPAGLAVALDLAQAADVTFNLFNIAGRLVGSHHAKWLAPGTHQLRLPVAGLAAGAYFLRTTGAGDVPPVKFVLAN